MSQSRLVLAVATVALFLVGCATETRSVGEPSIRFKTRSERFEDIAAYRVFRNGTVIGTAKQARVRDGDANDLNDRTSMFVHDMSGDLVGFVTDDYRAFQLRAHGDPELVAKRTSIEDNVGAVFGFTEGAISLARLRPGEEMPAAATQTVEAADDESAGAGEDEEEVEEEDDEG